MTSTEIPRCVVCGKPKDVVDHAVTGHEYAGERGELLVPVFNNGDGHEYAPQAPELTETQRRDVAAADLVGCLKMWGYDRPTARDILNRAWRKCKDEPTWKNPLEGTGMFAHPNNPGAQHK
jgi:hypothetical protein